jgi:hypothetical protein
MLCATKIKAIAKIYKNTLMVISAKKIMGNTSVR